MTKKTEAVMTKKPQLNVRVPQSTLDKVNTLKEVLGTSQAGVVVQAVRLLARREGVAGPEKPKNQKEA